MELVGGRVESKVGGVLRLRGAERESDQARGVQMRTVRLGHRNFGAGHVCSSLIGHARIPWRPIHLSAGTSWNPPDLLPEPKREFQRGFDWTEC
jgi:hypothetical protein